MKKNIVIITLLFAIGCGPDSGVIEVNDKPVVKGSTISSFIDLEINGCRQKVLIESDDVENSPILLYLHGGPGSSALIFSHIYSGRLKKNFIFVNWDQRGTAYSFTEGMDPAMMSEEQIRDDALELVRYLLKTFHRKKVFLLGHSFGSVIGLQLAANHPELFYAYIGVGQVIPPMWDEAVRITYDWLHPVLEANNDVEGLKRIEKDRFPYIDLVTKYGGHHRLSIDLESLKVTSPYWFYGYAELAKKGSDFSRTGVNGTGFSFHRILYKAESLFNESIYSIDVPLYFFEGVHDHVIASPPQIVIEYCAEVRAPVKEIIWFHDSAHYINVEEPEKFQDELIRIKQKHIQ